MRLILRAATSVVVLASAVAFADFDAPAPVAWRWAESTSVSPAGVPQVDGDNVYVAVGGRIYGISKESGNTMWRFPAGEPIAGNFRNGCLLSDGRVIAAGDEKSVYSVRSENGTLEWQYLSADPIATNLVASGNYIVFGTATEKLVALDATTGKPVWSAPVLVKDGLLSQIAAHEDNVIYATRRGDLVALNPITQRDSWSVKFQRLNGQGSFAVFGDRLYVNSGSFLTCLRAFNGQKLWQQNVGRLLDLAPSASADGVVTISRDGKMFPYNLSGRPMFPKGIDLKSAPVASPTYVGRNVVTVMSNGSVNLINPQSGDIVWNFTLPALVNRATSASGSGGGGDERGGGLGSPGSPGGGPGSPGGPGAGGAQDDDANEVNYTQAAAMPVVAGDSLYVLTRDGSLFLFDKNLGVDLTAPTASLVWPDPGAEIAGKAPMELIFKVEDWGAGINPDTIKLMIDGQEYLGEYLREGYFSVRITVSTKNKPLDNGRRKLTFSASDWMGNQLNQEFFLTINNTLPALGSPKKADDDQGGLGGGGFLGGGGGR